MIQRRERLARAAEATVTQPLVRADPPSTAHDGRPSVERTTGARPDRGATVRPNSQGEPHDHRGHATGSDRRSTARIDPAALDALRDAGPTRGRRRPAAVVPAGRRARRRAGGVRDASATRHARQPLRHLLVHQGADRRSGVAAARPTARSRLDQPVAERHPRVRRERQGRRHRRAAPDPPERLPHGPARPRATDGRPRASGSSASRRGASTGSRAPASSTTRPRPTGCWPS